MKNLIAEASELNIAPGEWPAVLHHEGRKFDLKRFHYDRERDVTAVDYETPDSAYRLRVFND